MLEPTKDVGHQRVTVSTVAIGFTVPDKAVFAHVRAKGTAGDGICFRSDGTDPTNATGMELEVGETMWFDGRLAKFKAIRRDARDVTLVVNYYTRG